MNLTKYLHTTAALLVAGAALVGCDAPHDITPFDDRPKGYVAFYIPADDPAYSELHVGAQVYRVVEGQRIFAGSTQKWKNLSPVRHGLTVAVPPGEHTFAIEIAGGTTPVTLKVEQDYYYPVRIAAYNVTHRLLGGMSDHIQFQIRATPETPIPPGTKHRREGWRI
ncbi:MAG: hypothetical protein Q7J36_11325 [Thiobacillus sp.]|nr:hypothetical protein [Thiobacillus sp.]